MTAPTRCAAVIFTLPYRALLRRGRACTLTEIEQIELVAWYKARCALGTWKTKARELNLSVAAIKGIVDRRLGLKS